MTIYLSLLVSLLGALVYAFASNGKLQEIGRLAYGCGLLAFLLQAAVHFVTPIR